MSNKLRVDFLRPNADEKSLMTAFSYFGEVSDVKVMRERETGRSRGYGFVTYATEREATSIVEFEDNFKVGGKAVQVTLVESGGQDEDEDD